METNGSENLATVLCRMGCGFYGSPSCDGMCSKCYKDVLKRKQNSSPVSGRMSPSVSATGEADTVNSVTSALGQASLGTQPIQCSEASSVVSDSIALVTSVSACTTPSVETATPTVSVLGGSQAKAELEKEEEASGGAEALDESTTDSSDSNKDKKNKKHRCQTCKKKTGLTGFQCRCGGLYCGLHRYSDKHDCTFNYKELAQEQIRKNNPVVVREKIQKI